jgi:hypothetical protein
MTAEEGAPAPTRTSTLLATAVAAVGVLAILSQARLVAVPALAGSAGVLCLAAGLRLVAADDGPGAAVAVSLLSVPAGLGLVVGTLGTSLHVLGAFFPARTTAQLSARSLLLAARVGIAVGCMAAVLGVSLGARGIVDADTLRAHYWQTLGTGAVPATAGGVLATGTVLSGRGPAIAGRLFGELGAWLVAPVPSRTHLASLCALVAFAALAAGAAVDALPLAELLTDSGDGRATDRRIERAGSALDWLGAAGVAGTLLGLVVELPLDPPQFERLAGPAAYRVLVGLSTAAEPRVLCLAVLAVSLPAVASTALLRRAARRTARGVTRPVGSLVGGGLLAVLAVAVSGPVLDALVTRVATELPGALGRTFEDVAGGAVSSFGSGAVLAALAAAVVAAAAVALLSVRLLVGSGYVAEATAGYSLASAGLFLAAACAGAAGFGRPIAFGGLVAALLVWDIGRYGTVLGQEVGPAVPDRTPELVHAGGSVAVGFVAVLVALGLASTLEAAVAGGSSLTAVALVTLLAGILLLVEALR